MSSSSPLATVYISVGSNIRPEENFRRALALLKEKTRVVAVSSVYKTPPMGYADQDDFLNMAVALETDLDPTTLRCDVLDDIEQRLGRERDPANKSGPRTIDLDISLWGDEVMEYGHKPWQVPHPDVTTFAHTAVPLAEIAPHYVHPVTGQTLKEVAAALPKDGFEKREDIRFSGLG